MYHDGKGVTQDYAEAAKWYRKAADQGIAEAQQNLGVMYENGQGVPQNPAEAVKRYRRAAEQGNATAQYNLGVNYENGQGVPKDDAEAAKWYRLAAGAGTCQSPVQSGRQLRPWKRIAPGRGGSIQMVPGVRQDRDMHPRNTISARCMPTEGESRKAMRKLSNGI